MSVILLPPADQELEEAIIFYNDQLPGLGEQFYREFLEVISLIEKHPSAWQQVGKVTRKINIKRFPCLILYVIDGNDIIITCIAHQHRKPTYYLDRKL